MLTASLLVFATTGCTSTEDPLTPLAPPFPIIVPDGFTAEIIVGGLDLPTSIAFPPDEPYHQPFSSAAQLHNAGVRFAMTGHASSGPNPPSRTLPYEAANAVKFGLPWEEAIKSITRYPGEILGLGDRLGTIETGKFANLIVTRPPAGTAGARPRTYPLLPGR